MVMMTLAATQCHCPPPIVTHNQRMVHEVEVVWAKAACGVWGQCHVFDGELSLIRDICKRDQIPKQLKVPVTSMLAKPAPKTARKPATQSTSASSSSPQPVPELPTENVQEFNFVWTRKKKFHTVPVEMACAQK